MDFSFTLVSSLTPRSHITRTPLTETNKLSSKGLKIKQNFNSYTENCDIFESSNKEKENQLPKNKQMKKNVAQLKVFDEICSEGNDPRASICFPVDMANIAVRRSKVRSSRRNKSSLLKVDDESLRGLCKDVNVSSSLEKKDSFCCDLNKIETSNILFENRLKTSKTITSSLNTKGNKDEQLENLNCVEIESKDSSRTNKGVKRKSPRFSEHSDISTDVIENSELKCDVNENNDSFSKNSVISRLRSRSGSIRLSDLSETSLSPAYDSDSFKIARRRGVKVIPETPETEESLQSNCNSSEKKHSLEIKAKKNEEKNTTNIDIKYSNVESTNLRPCGTIHDQFLPQDKKCLESCVENPKPDENPKKKLRSSNESSVSDMFQLESSIKKRPSNSVAKNNKMDPSDFKKDKRKISLSPVLKDSNIKCVDYKMTEPKKEKKSTSMKPTNRKKTNKEEENNCKPLRTNIKENNEKHSPVIVSSPKTNLIPPTEVIPKFEHISNWLKDTQEKSVIPENDSSLESPKGRQKKPSGKSKFLLSLSPRIKNKKKIAESTLQEEQKMFEELYGSDFAKRLSDDVDEVISIASSNESVQLSEKVLEKLYGTVWQKNAVLPQSEPRKGRRKSSSLQKKLPHTERKKQRTSIYDVFSSSSSEDRFEEFLESVQRGKVDPFRRTSNRPGTPEFINDSDSDSNTSIGFYHKIVSSGVKEDVGNLRYKNTDNVKKPTKVNRRRLSFASSKDDCSESGKSDTKRVDKAPKVSTKDTKKNFRKPRSKKKTKDCDEVSTDVNGFTLVTPLKVRDKKTENELSDRVKTTLEGEVPKSVGKSKTPKTSSKKDNNPRSEEELRRKYLEGDGFKVPKNLSSFKTPTRQASTKVPPSPSLSFLSSLSEMTAGLPCHPDALVYKKDFKNKREELTKKLFTLYNREVFDNKLPEDMLIQWSARMTSTSGYCYNKRIYSNNQVFRSSRIVLSTKILDRADRLRDTLIHELCHAATWIVNATSDGHGPNWRAWADKANCRFPELPVIKRCHDYAITTKFTYKCMSCGYCIGRHSKSLDTDRKRCGYCYGKFQVFVTAKMTTASATSGSDSVRTQRNPTGFALFVKDNYAVVKKQHNVPHGQVMKLLSQKFAEVKINKQSTDEQPS